MKKKQRNRKTVSQNKRNKMINRRYLSTIKTLFKVLSYQSKAKLEEKSEEAISQIAIQTESVKRKLISFLDKAVKKNVIHSNTAARKKSKISRFYFPIEAKKSTFLNHSN